MRLSIHHSSTYSFVPPMRGVVQSLRLWPSAFDGQQVLEWDVSVKGAVRGAAFRDAAGDWIETVTLLGPVEELSIDVSGEIETFDLAGVLRGHRERVPPLTYLRDTRATRVDLAIGELAEGAVAGLAEQAVLERAHALSKAVEAAILYTPGQTEEHTTAADALSGGKGVCQDHAHVLIAAARHVGIPARYVTGYLYSSADGSGHEASHAWAELHVPDLGWIGLDAANGQSPDEQYVRLGSGYDSQDAAPIRGIAQGQGTENLVVDVSISRGESAAQQ
ncbi:MAG: transglutaminase family protein [Pseudomonadota bacterium]